MSGPDQRTCRSGSYTNCDRPGDCGSPGGCGSDRTRAGACVTCPTLRPDSPAREPHQPPVCDGDRNLLDRYLGDISRLVEELTNPEPPIMRTDRYERIGVQYLKDSQRRIVSLGTVWADPVAALGGVAPINSRSKQPSVTGSKDRPIPVNATALDLTAPARVPATADWPEDQIGHLSAATVLDEWCRDVRARMFPDHHLPPATVADMAGWLRVRTDTICDQYPQVADYAESMRFLRAALRSAAGENETRPEPCIGVPCKRCDLMTLFRQPGGDVDCINPDCQAVLRGDEYHEWIKTLAAEVSLRKRAASHL